MENNISPSKRDLSPFVGKDGIVAVDNEGALFTCTLKELYPDDTALIKVGLYLSLTNQNEGLDQYSEIIIKQNIIFTPAYT